MTEPQILLCYAGEFASQDFGTMIAEPQELLELQLCHTVLGSATGGDVI